MSPIQYFSEIVLIGAGATAVMDLWLALLKRLGVPTLNFAFIGRWVGHLLHGQLRHAAIAKSAPVAGERILGWLTHYLVGIAFAGLLVTVAGGQWLRAPSLLPAIAVGMATVVSPLFVMQPAMGLGVMASKTPAPLKNCLRSVINHTVFGFGLFVSAIAVRLI